MPTGMADARIEDYGLIADGHTAALVHRRGSVDWCCLRRLDSGSVFGRLIDAERGGRLALAPTEPEGDPEREYLDGTLVLCTTWRARGGGARVLDFLAVDGDDRARARAQLVRIVEGLDGEVEFDCVVAPRFDYGAATPWIHAGPDGAHYAVAGDDGLLIACEGALEMDDRHELCGRLTVAAGERVRLEVRDVEPWTLDRDSAPGPEPPAVLDRRLGETVAWWRAWSDGARLPRTDRDGVLRSALAIKALANPRTGAIAAAATTSLPESAQGRTWDYRYSWVRDSVLSIRSLAALGLEDEAEAVRRFIQRSAAGHADELLIAYGVGGERRMPESELGYLRGWRGIGPVRVGNAAGTQDQHDVLGQLLDLAWHHHRRGYAPDDDLWAFVTALVERAVREWRLPDRGIWEWRGEPRHFTHSKVMCWVALDRGVRLAAALGRDAPLDRWRAERDVLRDEILTRGYDRRQRAFTQCFDGTELDASVLRLPAVGFLEARDERMVATVDAVAASLDDDRLLRRHRSDDGQPGSEGAFLACAFWLVECLAWQGRVGEARERFERALQARNDLGLFTEEYDTQAGRALGNVPQALTHFSHILAAQALDAAAAEAGEAAPPAVAARVRASAG
jgi:GH15 family glucan-1,4-alpha-glucosidase